MASIEVKVVTDDETVFVIRRPYETTVDTHVFNGTREESSNFLDVFDQVISDVHRVMGQK